MKKSMKYFRGYVTVTLNGRQPERFLNLCSYNNIDVWDLKYNGLMYEGKMYLSEYKQIRPLAKKTGMKVKVTGRWGLPFSIHSFRARKLFPVGMGLCLAVLYVLSLSVWDIEIDGNSYRTDSAIITFLSKKNLEVGTRKKDIDCEKIEKMMRTEYEDIIWASAKIKGTRLIIEVQENLVANRETKKDDGSVSIIADCDGVIYSIVTRRGVPLVKEGNKVKKGDVLVEGCVSLYNDAKEITGYDYCMASADILAYKKYTYKEEQALNQRVQVLTGKKKKVYTISIGGKEFTIPHFKNKYKKWDRITEDINLSVGKNFFLPVSIRRETIREVKKKKKTYTEKEMQLLLENNVELFCEELEEKGIQIIEKNVIIKKGVKGLLASGTIKVREYIGVYKPTEKKEITDKERQLEDELDAN